MGSKSEVSELLGAETENYQIFVSVLKGVQNMMYAPEGAKPQPVELIVAFYPKNLTFDDGMIEPTTGRRIPDKYVKIKGRVDAVTEVLKELLNADRNINKSE